MFVWFVFTCLWQWRTDSTMMGMMWQLWQLEWWLCMESTLSLFWWEWSYRWSFLPWTSVWWFGGHASHVLWSLTVLSSGHVSVQFARMKWSTITLTHCCWQVLLVVVQTIGEDLGLTALWIQAMVSFWKLSEYLSEFSVGEKHKWQTYALQLPPEGWKVVLSCFQGRSLLFL